MASVVAIDLASLRKAMTECLMWCDAFRLKPPAKVQVRACLRSRALAETAQKSLYWYLAGKDTAILQNPVAARASAEGLFGELVSLRNRLVAGGSVNADDVSRELTRNRALLLVNWAASISDPLADSVTSGYLDEFYLPPWDTWLALVPLCGSGSRRFLLSWVPPWARQFAIDEAIGADAMARLAWVSIGANEIVAGNWGER